MSEDAKIETLMRQFYAEQGKLKGYLFAATRDYHATEDLLQEIAIVVATKASTFDFERAALPWFIGIARNQIQRWLREQGRQARNINIDVLADCLPEFAAFSGDKLSSRQVALRKCLGLLPAGQREIVSLRYEGGLGCDQIADRAHRSIQSIYALLKRVKLALKSCVESQVLQEEAS